MTHALDEAETLLASTGLLNEPGAVLYSGASTLCPGPVYLLGLNPGGSGGSTLQESLASARQEHNCYLDEQWSPGGRMQPRGQAVLQRRVQQLCAALGLDTRRVPASNLVFTRSTRLATHSNFQSAADACNGVHEIFLSEIQPSILFTYGSIENFRGLVQLSNLESRSAEHGTWMAHKGIAKFKGRIMKFVNIPHMSLWASDKRPNVINWILR